MVLWFYGLCVMAVWFYGVMVLWLYDFMVVCRYGFTVLWFYSFIALWFYGFVFSKIYRITTPCFQEEIDPVSKIFQEFISRTVEICPYPSFPKLTNMWVCRILKSTKLIVVKAVPVTFLDSLEIFR